MFLGGVETERRKRDMEKKIPFRGFLMVGSLGLFGIVPVV